MSRPEGTANEALREDVVRVRAEKRRNILVYGAAEQTGRIVREHT